jgi:catechol 2,3-dioxygenase-like lactoylglutathione lyase family enzyme
MAIQLDHVIVPARDKRAGAKALAELLDVPWAEEQGHFAPVYVNAGLTLDFADREGFQPHHFCFRVSDEGFDAIFGRIKAAGLAYGGHPFSPDDGQVNTRLGGKNLYWRDADGHLWEILTVSYARPDSPDVTTSAPVAAAKR